MGIRRTVINFTATSLVVVAGHTVVLEFHHSATPVCDIRLNFCIEKLDGPLHALDATGSDGALAGSTSA